MSSAVSGHNKVCVEICEALGLNFKYIRKLDFHMAYNELATVSVEYLPEEAGVKQLVPILKKFNLVEAPEDVIPISEMKSFALKPDQSWLEERWLAETSIQGKAWYATSCTNITADAWKAKGFKLREECLTWIDSWPVPELQKREFASVSHGFVHEK